MLTNINYRNINHSGNKSTVIYNLVKNYISSKGVVDEDPGNPVTRLINQFQPHHNYHAYSINVQYDGVRDNYLISLYPKHEDWVLNAARVSHVDIRKYGLPNNSNHLKRIINDNLSRYEKFLDILIPVSQHMQQLQQILLDP